MEGRLNVDNLALVSIVFGAIIVLTRGPMIFVPDASKKFFLSLIFSSNTRIRIMGIFIVALGMIMINVARGYDLTAALIIKYFGWYLVVGAFSLLLIFTPLYKEIAFNIIVNLDGLILRIIGVFSVGLGAVFIYIGLVVF